MFGFRRHKANTIVTIKDDIKQKFAKSLDMVVPDPKTSEEPGWSDSGKSIEEFKQQYTMLVDNMLDRVNNAGWYNNAYSFTESDDAPVGAHQMSRKDAMKALYYYKNEADESKMSEDDKNGMGNHKARASQALFDSLKYLAKTAMGEEFTTLDSLEEKVNTLNTRGDFEKLFEAVGQKFYKEDSNFPGKPGAKGGKKTRKHRKHRKSKKARKSHKKRNKSHRKK